MSPDPTKRVTPGTAACELGEGQHLGKYAIVRRLGAGGMGTVYLAEDADLKRTVALKVLPRDRAENPTLVKRFKAEGQAAAQLHHKNIVQVYEAGEIDGYLYLALEFVDGIDLHAWIKKRGPLPVKRSLLIIQQVAQALQHAFEKNIVHRDIKPSNLMIKADGTVKLADMGLARSIDETLDTSITRDGTTVGTIDYMAPEQARNSKAADIRSDIYSLGCTWYHMLTGSPPFPEGSITNKVQAHTSAPRPNPQERNASVPAGIVAILHRMMASKPADRYRNPEELLADLASDKLFRQDLMPDLLAALSNESSGKRGPSTVPEEEEDWEQIFRRVRSSERDADEFEFDSEPALAKKSEVETREVEVESRPAGKKLSAGKKGKKPSPAEPSPAEQSARPAATRTRAGKAGADGIERDLRGNPMPAKMKNPEVGSAPKSIDVDFLKIGLLLAAVFGGSAGLWWGLNQYMGDSSSELPGANPYGNAFENGSGKAPAAPQSASSDQSSKPPGNSETPIDDTADKGPAETQTANGAAQLPDAGRAAKVRADVLPEWVLDGWNPPEQAVAPVVRTVRRGGEFHDLSSAVAGLPATGGIIELGTIGPHFAAPVILKGLGHVQVRGAMGVQPIVFVRGDSLDADSAWLSIERTSVLMEGIHLVYVGPTLPQDIPDRLLEVVSGELTLRECTLTCVGPPVPVIGCDLPGDSADGARILLDQCHFRGGALTSARITGAGDVVVSHSLLAADSTPCLTVMPGKTGSRKTSTVQISHSALVSSGSALKLAANEGQPNPQVDLLLHDALLARGPQATAEPAIALRDWSVEETTQLESPSAVGLRLGISQLQLAGWEVLTQVSNSQGEVSRVADVAGWRKFWRQPLGEEAIRPALFAGAAVSPDSVAPLDAASLTRFLSLKDNLHLPALPAEWFERLRATGERRRRPPTDIAADAEPIRFDLGRESVQNSLHSLIASDRCPDKSRIVCFGSGIKSLYPVTIKDKRVRIEFESTGNVPLDVRPAADVQGDALFTVEGGLLELVHAPLSIPESKGKSFPRSLVQVNKGEFVLRNSVLSAAPGVTADQPLIYWQGDVLRPTWGEIVDSVLRSDEAIVEGRMANASLVVSNSLLISGGRIFDLAGDQADGELTLLLSTFSAGEAVLFLQDAAPSERWQVFARNCVFAPPTLRVADGVTPAANSPASVISASTGALGALVWWEAGSAYATQLRLLTLDGKDAAPPPAMRDAPYVVDRLDGADGVVVAGVLESQRLASVEDFQLKPGCTAASWADDGLEAGFRPPFALGAIKATPEPATPSSPGRKPPRDSRSPAF